MASLFKRAKDFAQSPKGKQVTEEIKEQASKPENRRKLMSFGQRYMKKRYDAAGRDTRHLGPSFRRPPVIVGRTWSSSLREHVALC